MKIAVFGATGTVGRHVVLQALAAGHEVTAFTRSSEKLTGALSAETDKEIPMERLQVAEGDVLEDQPAVERAVGDKDVVIVALGAGLRGRVRAEGTRKIIEAMKKAGTRHLICQSTLGAGDSSQLLNLKWRWIFRGPLRWVMADHERQEAWVRESGLEWTIVRPGSFTDGPLTGTYRHVDTERPSSQKISRADVAHFLLREATEQTNQGYAVPLFY